MMVNAMEVSGIEGNYRRTCEKVMFVLRENRDSLVATLEAFVHDPLISWRLLNNTVRDLYICVWIGSTGTGVGCKLEMDWVDRSLILSFFLLHAAPSNTLPLYHYITI